MLTYFYFTILDQNGDQVSWDHNKYKNNQELVKNLKKNFEDATGYVMQRDKIRILSLRFAEVHKRYDKDKDMTMKWIIKINEEELDDPRIKILNSIKAIHNTSPNLRFDFREEKSKIVIIRKHRYNVKKLDEVSRKNEVLLKIFRTDSRVIKYYIDGTYGYEEYNLPGYLAFGDAWGVIKKIVSSSTQEIIEKQEEFTKNLITVMEDVKVFGNIFVFEGVEERVKFLLKGGDYENKSENHKY